MFKMNVSKEIRNLSYVNQSNLFPPFLVLCLDKMKEIVHDKEIVMTCEKMK